MSFANDMKDFVVGRGLGAFNASSGWSVNVNKEPVSPPSPETTITIYGDGGPAPHPSPEFVLRNPRAKFRVRGPAAAGGVAQVEAKTQQLFDLFHGLGPQFVSGSVYGGFWVEGEPSAIFFDDSNRPWQTLNISALSGGMSAAA